MNLQILGGLGGSSSEAVTDVMTDAYPGAQFLVGSSSAVVCNAVVIFLMNAWGGGGGVLWRWWW